MIELTPEQEEMVKLMLFAGVFDIRNGSAELHFDSLGRLASIDGHIKMFRKQQISTVVITKNN